MNLAMLMGHEKPHPLPARRRTVRDPECVEIPVVKVPKQSAERAARHDREVAVLADYGPHLCEEVAEKLGACRNTVIKDLAELRASGRVRSRKVGAHTIWWAV